MSAVWSCSNYFRVCERMEGFIYAVVPNGANNIQIGVGLESANGMVIAHEVSRVIHWRNVTALLKRTVDRGRPIAFMPGPHADRFFGEDLPILHEDIRIEAGPDAEICRRRKMYLREEELPTEGVHLFGGIADLRTFAEKLIELRDEVFYEQAWK